MCVCVSVWHMQACCSAVSAAPPAAARGSHVRLVMPETPTDLGPPLPLAHCTDSLESVTQTLVGGAGHMAT